MNKRVACIGYGALTPVGITPAECYLAAAEGRSALTLHTGTFGCANAFVASLFEDRSAIAGDYTFFDSLIIRAASQAIESAGIDPASGRVAFVLSTIKGNIEFIGKQDISLPASAARMARHFNNPNPATVVSNACISGLAALVQGRRMMLTGKYDYVVVVGAEVQSHFIVSGFQSLKALSGKPCRPFDAGRDGLNLGEAAAAMVLGNSAYGWELAEGAVRNDANHISGPSRTGEGSYNALRYVLREADIDDISFINPHGTATLYNDEMEAIAIDRAGLANVPLFGLKGCFGHTMGAAGILESIISMMACDNKTILPTKGFENLGVSVPVQVSASKRSCTGRSFVKLLSGFGGVNGALLFKKGGQA